MVVSLGDRFVLHCGNLLGRVWRREFRADDFDALNALNAFEALDAL
jgi:hypothetical protein